METFRRSQRIALIEPIPGKLDKHDVLIIDLGHDGAGIEHYQQLPQQETHTLTVDWRQPFSTPVKIRYSELRKLADATGPSVYHSGADFFHLDETGDVVIDSILIDEVRKKLVEWEANMSGTRRDRIPHLRPGAPRITLPGSFSWYRFVDGEWLITETRDPNQPIDGFAVRSAEDPEQVKLLCSAYEAYDVEDQQMLRMMAHLTIAESVAK